MYIVCEKRLGNEACKMPILGQIRYLKKEENLTSLI